MPRRRILRPDELDLWQTVARSTKPLHGKPAGFHRRIEPVTAPAASAAPPEPFAPFRLGEKSRITPAAHPLGTAPLQMDAKAFGKMTRGKLAPEARIDLHGMTLAEAHPELIRFILNAQSAGLRLVLVITGKGKRGADHGPIPQRIGALRRQVPLWLRLAPLAAAVLQVSEAHLKHGGAGAFYVYLRRR